MTKQTDVLIKILSQSSPVRAPLPFSAAALLLSILSLAITFTVMGTFRPELMTLSPPTGFFIKTAILSGFAFTAYLFLKQAAKPVPVFPPLAAALIMPAVLSGFVVWEWMNATSIRDTLSVVFLPNFRACLLFVGSYGLGGIVALTFLMKQYAPVDVNKAAGLIGLGAASACALGYSFHCPIDSPTFIFLAYGLPMASLGLLARFIVPKFIRW